MTRRLFILGIVWLLAFSYSCQQKNGDIQEQEAAGRADTLATTSEEIQEEENKNVLDLTYAQRRGKRLYDKYCAVCHGLQGEGDGFNAYNLDPKPKDITGEGYLESVTDNWLVEAIGQGGRGVKRSVLMPSYENTLTRDQIEDVVAYLRFLAK